MHLLRTRADLAEARAASHDSPVGAVLTMGALHAGHLALVHRARELVGPSGVVALSIFVNPLQFGPSEDLARYPRPLEDDLAAAQRAGVDLVFVPDAEQIYPDGEALVTVDPGHLGTIWEGAARPVHFRGVLTVVATLLHLIDPALTVFGEKDYQQLVLVRRMVRQLAMPVDVVACPTVREPDGLALSSRNVYLDRDERARARALSRALTAGQRAGGDGPEAVLDAATRVLARQTGLEVDYLALTDPDMRGAPRSGTARLLVAARVGATRLLDNVAVVLGEREDAA